MPGQDKTGPLGQGPLTGRGLGPCGRGLAFRKGLGRESGRGFGVRFFQPTQPQITETEEKQPLKEELELMEKEKKEIEKRLKELKA